MIRLMFILNISDTYSMKRKISYTSLLLANLLIISLASDAFAGTKTFIREYTYNASEADSKLSSRAIAIDQVKRLLLEEISVFIEATIEKEEWVMTIGSETEVGGRLIDKITSITAGITKTKILDERWDGEEYYLKAEIKVDPDEIHEKVKRILRNRENLLALEEKKRKADKAFAEIRELKIQLENARSKIDKLRARRNYKEKLGQNINILALPPLEGEGIAEIQIDALNLDELSYYKKRIFISAFSEALSDIIGQVALSFYSSKVYNDQDVYSSSAFSTSEGIVGDFELLSLVFISESGTGSNLEWDGQTVIIMKYEGDTYYIQNGELKYPVSNSFITFPKLKMLTQLNAGVDVVTISGILVKQLNYEIEGGYLRCTLKLVFDNRKI